MTLAARVVGAAVLVAVAAAGCRGLGPVATPDDLASWQAAPLPADPRLAQAAVTSIACNAGNDTGPPPQILLQDRRTASTAAFLVSGPAFSGSCLVTLSGGAGGGSGRSQPLEPATAAIVVDEGSSGGTGSSSASLVGGRAAVTVATVTIDLNDGRVVRASVGNGHWLAWWPGELGVKQIVARDAAGTVLATLDDATPGWKLK